MLFCSRASIALNDCTMGTSSLGTPAKAMRVSSRSTVICAALRRDLAHRPQGSPHQRIAEQEGN